MEGAVVLQEEADRQDNNPADFQQDRFGKGKRIEPDAPDRFQTKMLDSFQQHEISGVYFFRSEVFPDGS